MTPRAVGALANDRTCISINLCANICPVVPICHRLSAVLVVRCGVGHSGDLLKALNFKITLDALLNRNSCLQLTEVRQLL